MRLVVCLHELDFVLERRALWQALTFIQSFVLLLVVRGAFDAHVAVEKLIFSVLVAFSLGRHANFCGGIACIVRKLLIESLKNNFMDLRITLNLTQPH